MIKVGVVGYGYWGPNLVRNFMSQDCSEVVVVSDLDAGRLARVSALYPTIRTTTDTKDLLNDRMIDAVVVATPVRTHFDIAMAALKAGKHVLVEKPITTTVDQAQQLIDEAERRGLVLMVDHTFVFTGAVRKMHDLVRQPDFGQLHYYDSTRVNLGLFQHDVNVLWDLAVHDLSIMTYVLGTMPKAVSATGHARAPGQPEYAAFLTVYFADMIAHINVNWLSPVKLRRTLVGGSGKMIVYDDLEAIEKIKLYDKGVTVTENPEDMHKMLISYRTGDMWSPKLEETEALTLEARHFVECIERREKPTTSGEQGLELIRILEAADKSLRQRGAPQELK
jgi:predicted dehydrogenase